MKLLKKKIKTLAMMKYDVIIGIDCGISNGSIASYHNQKYTTVKMPTNNLELNGYIQYLKSLGKTLVVIEKQHLQLGDVKGGKIFNTQKLVKNYNDIILMLSLLGVDHVPVSAMEWQGYLGLTKKNEEYKERKARLKVACDSMIGKYIKVTGRNADSLLLAIFGIKKLQLENDWIKEKISHNQSAVKYLNL